MVSVYTFKWVWGISNPYVRQKYLITLDCSGKGVEDDPYLIDYRVKPPLVMIIENSSDYILIEDYEFSQIYIESSSNVTLRNVRAERLGVKKSLNINIEKCSISSILQFKKTDNFGVSNCEIYSLKLTKIKQNDSIRRKIIATNNVNRVYL